MAQPSPYVPGYDFSGYQANNPTAPLPGWAVDQELASISRTTNETITRLAIIQRDDGELTNKIVHWDSLDDYLRGLLHDATNLAEAIARAEAAAEAAEQALEDFRRQYYGAAATDPTVDPYGFPPTIGDIYFNTVSQALRIFTTSGWIPITNARIVTTPFTGNGALNTFNLGAQVDNEDQVLVYCQNIVGAQPLEYVETARYSLVGQTQIALAFTPANGIKGEFRIFEVVLAGTPGVGTVGADEITNDPTELAEIAEKIGALSTVENVAAVYALAGGLRGQVFVKGYYAEGDGGDGTWVWRQNSVLADNGTTVVLPTGQNPGVVGRWERVIQDGRMSIRAFGARGDDQTDDRTAFQAALDWQKASAGEIFLAAGRYRVKEVGANSTLKYYTSTHTHGLRIAGEGVQRSVIVYGFANGRSLLKIRGTGPSQFMQGGYLKDFAIVSAPTAGDPAFNFHSQQCAIDIGNWIRFSWTNLLISGVKGHGMWAPYQFLSVQNLLRTNDKPWVVVDSGAGLNGSPGCLAHLQAQVDPSDGHIIGFEILRGGHNYTGTPAIRVYGCGTGFSGNVTVTNGAVTGYSIGTPGTGYYEETDHLYDNEDTFTVGLAEITNCQIIGCDGVGMLFPHFASSGIRIFGNYIIVNAGGGLILGGNNIPVQWNSIATNGNHPNAGWFPGIWLRRTRSNANNIAVIANELDSNVYSHVLLDGTNPGEITANRCNSWVTLHTSGLGIDFKHQTPMKHIAFETGNPQVTNSKYELRRNAHRAQPPGTYVPNSVANAQTGVNVLSGIVGTPLGASTFAVGMTVQVTIAGSPITFGPGNLPTADIIGVNYGAGTLTLNLAPNSTGTTANTVVSVVIPVCHVTWVDFGRSVNTGSLTVFEPLAGQQPTAANDPSSWLVATNWARVYSDPFDVRYNSNDLLSSGVNSGSYARIISSSVVPAFPAANVFLDPIAFPAIGADRGNYLSVDGGGLGTGRYRIPNRGIFEISGQMALATNVNAAGAGLELSLVQNTSALDGSGVPTAGVDATLGVSNYVLGSAGREDVRFYFQAYCELLQTYVGDFPPFAASASSSDNIYWWNPHTLVLQQWNNVSGLWTVIPYATDRGRYLVTSTLRLRGRINGAVAVPFFTASSSAAWITFKQVG